MIAKGAFYLSEVFYKSARFAGKSVVYTLKTVTGQTLLDKSGAKYDDGTRLGSYMLPGLMTAAASAPVLIEFGTAGIPYLAGGFILPSLVHAVYCTGKHEANKPKPVKSKPEVKVEAPKFNP